MDSNFPTFPIEWLERPLPDPTLGAPTTVDALVSTQPVTAVAAITQPTTQPTTSGEPVMDREAVTLEEIVGLKPVTADEIAAHPEWRGLYALGKSTRRDVVLTERMCYSYNCWQIRQDDGSLALVSEPPNVYLAYQKQATPTQP